MQLVRIQIENFRAIRKASLDLDETTVLIGENNSGRSSILEALALVLQPRHGPAGFGFEPHHLHRAATGKARGPLRIQLTFRERSAGEWGERGPQLALRLGKRKRREPREIVVDVRARGASRADGMDVEWSFGTPGGRTISGDTGMLEQLRQECPLLWVPAHPFSARPNHTEVQDAAPAARPDELPLADRVRAHYQRLLDGTTLDASSELQAGFEAARDLLARAGARAGGGVSGRDAVLAEILGQDRVFGTLAPPLSTRHGTAAHKIGLLLLAGSLLEAIGEKQAPGAQPVLVIEDPEAHLHPMTLAVVWDLIENIRFQKIVGTHSGPLLSRAPLHIVRRLTRSHGAIEQWRVQQNALTREELRKFTYHVRAHRGEASFARCWLLVEGESEFWLMPEFARVLGYELAAEGIACVEFAQCGLPPLIKAAQGFGIRWHVLADGDMAGHAYARTVEPFVGKRAATSQITVLEDRDIEHCMWRYGYQDVYLRNAGLDPQRSRRLPAKRVIAQALDRTSKPFMALEVLAAVAEPGSPGVPEPLRHAIEACVQMARRAAG